jgi:putative tryptophan/tyrosine transport system substrate-binding protein
MISRRQWLCASAVSLAFARPVLAQQGRTWRLGFLSARSRLELPYLEQAFIDGMRDLGYVEDRNLAIERRYADDRYERLASLAQDLVARRVDLIVATPSPAIRAAQKATATIPIVFPSTGDPVGSGFVASLAKPGGNITGISNSNLDVSAKLLQLLKDIAPQVVRVAILGNPGSATHASMLKSMRAAALHVALDLVPINAATREALEPAFVMMVMERVDALVIAADAFLVGVSAEIATLASKNRFPSVTQFVDYPRFGGLLSYGRDLRESYRRAATLVDKIFKGAKPAELPVEQPTRFALVINRKTARDLGLSIPADVLLRADEVIDS